MLVMKNVMFGNYGCGRCASAGPINTDNASITEAQMAVPAAVAETTELRREILCMATLLKCRQRAAEAMAAPADGSNQDQIVDAISRDQMSEFAQCVCKTHRRSIALTYEKIFSLVHQAVIRRVCICGAYFLDRRAVQKRMISFPSAIDRKIVVWGVA